MLHDFFCYDWHDANAPHWHGYVHAEIALKNADKEIKDLTDKERNIIYSHMWPLNITHFPQSKEASIICLADKYCAIRETMGNYRILRLMQKEFA